MRFNDELARIDDSKSAQFELDAGIIDGMAAAADETLRVLPMQRVASWIDETFFDDSEKLTGTQANEMFKLQGEYAFRDDEETTYNTAAAKSKDLARVTRNELIQATVNEDSPILGRVTQFAASIAAGVTDPLLMGANLAAGMGVASLVGRLAASSKFINGIARVSPSAGNMLTTAYQSGVNKSVMTVLAREGAENFVGALAEESINFAGIGSNRLSRKVTTEESLFNIFAGTVLGAGLGTMVSSDGRASLARSYLRRFGDDAGDAVSAKIQADNIAHQTGIKEDIISKTMDEDTFSARPWYEGIQELKEESIAAGYQSPKDSKFYYSLDENGQMVNYTNNGKGTVATNNLAHAFNKGETVIEVDPSQLNILDGVAFAEKGVDIANNIIDTSLSKVFKGKRNKLEATIRNIDQSFNAKGMSDEELIREFREFVASDAKFNSIHDVAEFVDELGYTMDKNFGTNQVIDEVLDSLGFDSYSFVGRGATGENKFSGLYVTEKGQARLQESNRIATPKANEQQKMQYDEKIKKNLEEYHDNFSKKQLDVQNETKVTDPNIKLPPADNINYLSSWNGVISSDKKLKSALTNEIERLKADMDNIAPDDIRKLKMLESVIENKNIDKLAAEDASKFVDFINCIGA